MNWEGRELSTVEAEACPQKRMVSTINKAQEKNIGDDESVCSMGEQAVFDSQGEAEEDLIDEEPSASQVNKKVLSEDNNDSELEQDSILFSPSLKTYLTQNSNLKPNPMQKKSKKVGINPKDSLFFQFGMSTLKHEASPVQASQTQPKIIMN